jgi:hypothetical protein
VLLNGFGKGAENNAEFRQLAPESRGHGDAVKHCIHSDTTQPLLLLQGDAQLLIHAKQLRIDLAQTLRALFLRLGS